MNKIYSKINHKASLMLFGNTISFKINILHYSYNFIAKCFFAFYNPKSIIDNDGCGLKIYGMESFKPFINSKSIFELTRKSDILFNNSEKIINSLSDSGLIRMKNSFLEMPELEDIINSKVIANYLKKYFKSNFKIYSCDIYRTVPSCSEDKEKYFSSLLWHFDNCPSNLIKVMIYLNDVNISNGAISLVDKKKSIELRRKGFWNRWDNNKFLNVVEDNKVFLEGEAGTTLIFSTHYCIHKATLPEVGYRDVAVFLVQPSVLDNNKSGINDKENISSNFGYCINPYTNSPLRVGYE